MNTSLLLQPKLILWDWVGTLYDHYNDEKIYLAENVLNLFYQKKVPQMIISNGMIADIQTLIDNYKWQHFFIKVFCPTFDLQPKPSGNMLIKAMQMCNVQAHDVIFFGDSFQDQQAAMNAQCNFYNIKNNMINILEFYNQK